MKIFYKHFQSICKGRGVSDILGVKLKYVTRAERAAREVYHWEVERWRRTVGKRSQVVKIMNENENENETERFVGGADEGE